MKRIIIILLTLTVLMGSLPFALAEDSAPNPGASELLERLVLAPEFEFRLEKPLGYGLWNVYSAPSADSFRSGTKHNARYNADSGKGIGAAGCTSSGWMMISYEPSTGGHRVGYVSKDALKGFTTVMVLPDFDYIPAVAEKSIIVQESHFADSGFYHILNAGDPFYVLGKYTYYGDWWYIEYLAEGKQCRGFIDRTSSSFAVEGVSVKKEELPNPSVSPKGTVQIGTVTIDKGNLDKVNTRQKPDPDSGLIGEAYFGKSYPCYGEQMGTTYKPWYYIFIEEISAFCWVSSSYATLTE